jgi:hypothetical protein
MNITSEPLLARITQTQNGNPPTGPQLKKALGSPHPASDDATWFWIFATSRSALRMRLHGHHARGTLFTTYVPVQKAFGPWVQTYPPEPQRTGDDYGVRVYDEAKGEWVEPYQHESSRPEWTP